MQAVAVAPDTGPAPKLIDLPEPAAEPGDVLVEGLLVGVCGTDRAVVGEAARLPGRLVLGHESLGRVVDAPDGTDFHKGDLVVGLIRRPCPELCRACRAGELDRCLSRPPVERGISRADGFAAELWTSPPAFLCPVPAGLGEAGVLIEPASSIVKGLRRLNESGSAQAPRRALVLGGGAIGVLCAAILVRRGVEVDLADPFAPGRRELIEALGAQFLRESPAPSSYDLAVEASGGAEAVGEALAAVGPLGRVLVLGMPAAPAPIATQTARLVMNDVEVIFSVNATAADHRVAARELGEIERSLLARLMGRELPLAGYEEALVPDGTAPKTVVRVAP